MDRIIHFLVSNPLQTLYEMLSDAHLNDDKYLRLGLETWLKSSGFVNAL